ncbi:ankyrin repeat domain-containing protein [Prevotella sp. KH2C16]|uniref:ankyrin repeat domain-containing protein n=1 Tax=Prevotella sp. KH2C16 TaxID=1855325 RepID=UPI0008ECB401|nr:ankyrin repeat domain-containing protein [Prevotella sp. KH2C16]SFG42048.1 Ankyrin repeat-containing protein [Prevotella sp. KH2C16]
MAKKRQTLPRDFKEIMERNDIRELEQVFEKCDINAYERDWMKTPALCMYGVSCEFISWLVAHGADIEGHNCYGRTPLLVHASTNQEEKVKLLLGLGADVHAEDKYGNGVLHFASGPEVMEVLLAHGADVRARNQMGETPLLELLKECSNSDIARVAQMAGLLLEAGDEPTAETREQVICIGKSFEAARPDFAANRLEAADAGLRHLYTLFGVTPVEPVHRHDGSERITVKAKEVGAQFEELWNMLVPASGHAPTVQGEVIRICGKVAREVLDNGACNWDRDYRKLPQSLPGYFAMGHPIPGLKRTGLAALLPGRPEDENQELAALARSIGPESTEEDFNRLYELAVKWVLANPEPIKLGRVGYRR